MPKYPDITYDMLRQHLTAPIGSSQMCQQLGMPHSSFRSCVDIALTEHYERSIEDGLWEYPILKRRTNITVEQREKDNVFISDYENPTIGTEELCKRYSIKNSTIYARKVYLRNKLKPQRRPETARSVTRKSWMKYDIDIQEVYNRRLMQVSYAKIGEEFGISERTLISYLTRWCKEQGLDVPTISIRRTTLTKQQDIAAWELKKSGKSPDEICKELGITKNMYRKTWIRGAKTVGEWETHPICVDSRNRYNKEHLPAKHQMIVNYMTANPDVLYKDAALVLNVPETMVSQVMRKAGFHRGNQWLTENRDRILAEIRENPDLPLRVIGEQYGLSLDQMNNLWSHYRDPDEHRTGFRARRKIDGKLAYQEWQAGKSFSEIGRENNVSVGVVTYNIDTYIQENGLDPRENISKPNIEAEAVYKFVQDNPEMTYKEVGQVFDRDPSGISELMRKRGICRNPSQQEEEQVNKEIVQKYLADDSYSAQDAMEEYNISNSRRFYTVLQRAGITHPASTNRTADKIIRKGSRQAKDIENCLRENPDFTYQQVADHFGGITPNQVSKIACDAGIFKRQFVFDAKGIPLELKNELREFILANPTRTITSIAEEFDIPRDMVNNWWQDAKPEGYIHSPDTRVYQFTEEQLADACAMRIKGSSYDELADIFNTTHNTIRRAIVDYAERTGQDLPKSTYDIDEPALVDYLRKYTRVAYTFAAKKFGVPANTVRRIAKKHGITRERVKSVDEKNGFRPIITSEGEVIETYQRYMKSRHWRKLRATMISAARGCTICGCEDELRVHHHTYERIGCEDTTDLVVLCDSCHARIHQEERHHGISLVEAYYVLLNQRMDEECAERFSREVA